MAQRLVGRPRKGPTPSEEKLQARLEARVNDIQTKSKRIDKQLFQLKLKMQKSKGAALVRVKQQAKQLIKMKKAYGDQIQKLEGQMFNSDMRQLALENGKSNVETYKGMKKTAAAMKKQAKKLNPEKAQKVMDDLEDARLDIEEVGETLAGNGLDDVDEDELEEELSALLGEDMDLDLDITELDKLEMELPGAEELFPIAPSKETEKKEKDGSGPIAEV